MRASAQAEPGMDYWECLWISLQELGWSLRHISVRDKDSGSARHLIHAKSSSNELYCSAPTLAQALEMIYAQGR